jgi:type I restriction enzyme S subunit
MVEWENTTIGKLLVFKNGLNKGKEFFGQGTPIVNYMDVYKNRGIHAEQLHGRVTLSTEEIKRFDVQKGDVFFTRTSETPEEVGYSSVMLDDIADCVFSGFVLRGRPITDKLDILFCQYAFMTETVRKAIISSCTYTTRALTNGNQLSKIKIKLPERSEQRRIAKALSETDKLIIALEKLIAKKQAIKQGAIQELLTGKRRLSGFSGEWVEKKLGEVGVITGSGVDKKINENETPVTLLNYLDVYRYTYIRRNMLNHVVTAKQEKLLLCNLQKGDVFFTPTSETADDIAKTAVAIEDMNDVVYSYHVVRLRPFEYYNGIFVKYACDTTTFIEQTTRLADGSGTRYVISLPKFRDKLIILVPPTIEEQIAIASILSDMDAEIDTLSVKLNKLRNIKQGMMSELLTGRIRLPEQKKGTASEAKKTLKTKKPPKQTTKKVALKTNGHNQQFDDAVMIAGIVNVLYSDKYPLGRKKIQKCLYLLRRHKDESTAAFKKKAAGPYADEVRYKGGEPIAIRNGYIKTQKGNQGTKFAIGEKVSQALGYIENWGKQADIQWVEDKLKYKGIEKLELLATVDMAICDLTEAGTPVSVAAIKNLIANNVEWKAKLKKKSFSDDNIADAIRELQILLQVENQP